MNKPRNSIKTRIRILFILLMATSIAVVEFIVFYHWKASIDQVIIQVQNEADASISDTIGTFIGVPPKINEMNQLMIKNGIVDIEDEKQREVFFAGVLKAVEDSVYSFSYGTEQGEYYGARRNKNNQIELMRSDSETEGRSLYYSTTEDFTAGVVVEQLGPFDPRTRDWYQLAKEAKRPVFSTVYKHFVMNDLAISASHPIYDNQGGLKGVLGTHITLSKINGYLKKAVENKNASAFIVERGSGELIANSLGMPNFETSWDGVARRVPIGRIDGRNISGAYLNFLKEGRIYSTEKDGNHTLHVKISELNKSGLDWLVITAISDSKYAKVMDSTLLMALLLSLLALTGTIIIWTKSMDSYLKPIYSLIQASEKFSRGNLFQRAEVMREDEIGTLAKAFNEMAENIRVLVNSLEEKVAERTRQLIIANEKLELLLQLDYLTDLYNRRSTLEKMEQEIARSKRTKKIFSIIMGDIDHFKRINDSYGHDCGDLILKGIAGIMKELVRETDCVSRWGGEEFLVLLPETELDGAVELAERIRKAVEKKDFLYQSMPLKVTMTFGVAAYKEGMDIDAVIKNADMALYEGKNSGRNRAQRFDG